MSPRLGHVSSSANIGRNARSIRAPRLEYPCILRVYRVYPFSAFRTPHAAHGVFSAALRRFLEPKRKLGDFDTLAFCVLHLNFVCTLPMGVHRYSSRDVHRGHREVAVVR